jgi:hypothetical protein
MTEPKESRTVLPVRLNSTELKKVQAVNATRTLRAALSTALTVAGLALMLTTHDATVRMLACCLVANEIAGGGRL